MALYTLPKQYHPDFAEPTRKPTGGVEIAQEYKDYVRFAWMGLGKPNLYDGNMGVISGSNLEQSNIGQNLAVDFNGSSRIKFDAGYNSRPPILSTTESFGVFIESKADNLGSFDIICTLSNNLNSSNGGYKIGMSTSLSYKDFWIGSATGGWAKLKVTLPAGIANTDNIRLAIFFNGGTYTSASDFEVFVNEAPATVVLNTSGFAATANATVISGEYANKNEWHGKVGHVYALRGLSRGMFDKLLYNHHGILEPTIAPVYFTADGGGGAITANANFDVAAPTFSVDSTNTSPSINSAGIAYTIAKPLFSSTSTITAPVFDASVGFIIDAPIFSATADSIAPINDATISYTISAPLFSVSANNTTQGNNAEINYFIAAPTFAADSTIINPAGATVAFSIGSPAFSANSTNTKPLFSSTITLDVNAPIFSVNASRFEPGIVSNVNFTLQAPTFSASASIVIPDNDAGVSFTISAPLFSVTAGTDSDVFYYGKGTRLTPAMESRTILLIDKSRQLRI